MTALPLLSLVAANATWQVRSEPVYLRQTILQDEGKTSVKKNLDHKVSVPPVLSVILNGACDTACGSEGSPGVK